MKWELLVFFSFYYTRNRAAIWMQSFIFFFSFGPFESFVRLHDFYYYYVVTCELVRYASKRVGINERFVFSSSNRIRMMIFACTDNGRSWVNAKPPWWHTALNVTSSLHCMIKYDNDNNNNENGSTEDSKTHSVKMCDDRVSWWVSPDRDNSQTPNTEYWQLKDNNNYNWALQTQNLIAMILSTDIWQLTVDSQNAHEQSESSNDVQIGLYLMNCSNEIHVSLYHV